MEYFGLKKSRLWQRLVITCTFGKGTFLSVPHEAPRKQKALTSHRGAFVSCVSNYAKIIYLTMHSTDAYTCNTQFKLVYSSCVCKGDNAH